MNGGGAEATEAGEAFGRAFCVRACWSIFRTGRPWPCLCVASGALLIGGAGRHVGINCQCSHVCARVRPRVLAFARGRLSRGRHGGWLAPAAAL